MLYLYHHRKKGEIKMRKLEDETKKSIKNHLISALIDLIVGLIVWLITKLLE